MEKHLRQYDYTYLVKKDNRQAWLSGTLFAENKKEARKTFDMLYGYGRRNVPYPFKLHFELRQNTDGGGA